MESQALEDDNPRPLLQEADQPAAKPFLGRCSVKLIPVGAELHQIQPPPLVTLADLRRNPDSVVRGLTAYRRTEVFQASRCRHLDLDSYLLFAEQYLEDKEPEIFQQGALSREQVHRKACELLHRCDYNISRARFLLVFPYYGSYDRMRSYRPLQLTDEERELKIREHLEGLKENRSKDLQRWVSQIQESIESRISLSKLNQIIDMARQNKFEVPDTIRDQIDRASKFGREIKKWSASKQLLEKLRQRRETLTDQKIITNDMSNFEEAVVRSEDWTERAVAYENEIFLPVASTESPVRLLRPRTDKIDFRDMHSLVADYNSLPVLNLDFEANTKRIHDETLLLLDRIPPLTKTAKTRTSTPTKITFANIRKLQADIARHQVCHDQFVAFNEFISDSLELMQRILMFLEDERSERNTKIMQSYLKLLNDVPILSGLPARLENYIEYYQIVDRIRKDIINPNRFEQTHELIKEASQKGFYSPELAEYENKLKVYRGWFESTQILSESERETRLVDLIREEGTIIGNMIDEQTFRAQLHYARTQLNVDANTFKEYARRLDLIDQQKLAIRQMLARDNPDLRGLVETLVGCIRDSIKYPEFIALYMRINQILTVLVKVNCLLELYKYSDQRVETFLKRQEYEELLLVVSSRRQIRELTKEAAEKLALEINERKSFPRSVPEWRLFMSFLQYSREWEDEATEFLREYANTGELDDMTLDELLVRSERVLADQSILEHLTEVHQIAKWKGVIQQRLGERSLPIFGEGSKLDMMNLENALSAQQTKIVGATITEQEIKREALVFLFEHRRIIQGLLLTITRATIYRTQKLPELVRTLRDIERLNVRDGQLDQMKHQLAKEIYQCEMWKDRYLALRKLDIRRRDREMEEQEPAAEEKQTPNKRRDRHSFRSQEFSYYFKLPALLVEFHAGTKLRVTLQELNKLKFVFEEAYEFMQSSRRLLDVEMPTAAELFTLEAEGSKLPLFTLEGWMVRKRSKYVQCWVNMANTVLESVPILKLEELHASTEEQHEIEVEKPPSKSSRQELSQLEPVQQKQVESPPAILDQPEILTTKRVRKQNPHYNNSEITLFTEELFTSGRTKKKLKLTGCEPEQTSAYQRKQKEKQELRNQKMQFEVSMYLQDPVAYCICRMGLMNESSVMVMCENCDAWFHAECIGIRKSYVKNIQKYYCVACCRKLGVQPQYLQSFVWTSRGKLSEQQFEALLQEGREMQVKLEQLPKLELLEDRIRRWKKSVARIIEQTTGKDIIPRNLKKPISQLYLESFWLPTRHLETDFLERMFLQKS